MSRIRLGLGWLATGFLVLSCGAHSIFGWSVLRPQLAALDPELVGALGLGWRLGGAAMLAFAAIAAHALVEAGRGRAPSLVPLRVVAATYVVYGLWAVVVSGGDPFFAVAFVAPGLALGVAAWPETRGPGSAPT